MRWTAGTAAWCWTILPPRLARRNPGRRLKTIARETFRRIGENYFSSIKTRFDELCRPAPVRWNSPAWKIFRQPRPVKNRKNAVVAIGHFGNFEIYARIREVQPAFTVATPPIARSISRA